MSHILQIYERTPSTNQTYKLTHITTRKLRIYMRFKRGPNIKRQTA